MQDQAGRAICFQVSRDPNEREVNGKTGFQVIILLYLCMTLGARSACGLLLGAAQPLAEARS